MWEIRNKARHGSDEVTRYAARYQQAAREISQLYDYEDQVLALDRSIFDQTLEDLLQEKAHHLRQWINVNKGLIQHSIKEAATAATSNMRAITHYFNNAD